MNNNTIHHIIFEVPGTNLPSSDRYGPDEYAEDWFE